MGFYAEKPIKLDVNGAYEELAQFSSGVAALPRIVTLHEIVIKPKDGNKINMTATAKTYRYLEDK
jgi:type IV pilus assembly protein PilO